MLKRSIDILVAALALMLFSPIMLLVAGLVRWKLGGPVLFRQLRPGLLGRPFQMVKFRTMTDAVGPNGKLLSDADRLPQFGKTLRASSLDELPEIWNVLVGDMSIVGPRPLLIDYLPLYSPLQARRHEMRPGITGWAQINGRNALSWEEKFALDVWYVENQSFALDFKIFWLTFLRVAKPTGVSGHGEATMTRFEGTKP